MLKSPSQVSAYVSAAVLGAVFLLLGNPLERCVVVESKVAGVDDVLSVGLSGEVVQRVQVA
jgi:hypothetical protein